MPTPHKPISKLAYKASFLSPTTPTPAGQVSPAERWCEIVGLPLAEEAFKHALGEYACTLGVDLAQPGAAAFKLVGAREVLNVLRTIGEPSKPTFSADEPKRLTPPD